MAAAFGGPFATAYHFHASSQTAAILQTGWLGYTWPSLRSLFELTLGLDQGLFVYCPLVGAGLAGAAFAWRAGKARGQGSATGGCANWQARGAGGRRFGLRQHPAAG